MMETLSSNNPFRGSSADQYGRLTGDGDDGTARRKNHNNNPFEMDESSKQQQQQQKQQKQRGSEEAYRGEEKQSKSGGGGGVGGKAHRHRHRERRKSDGGGTDEFEKLRRRKADALTGRYDGSSVHHHHHHHRSSKETEGSSKNKLKGSSGSTKQRSTRRVVHPLDVVDKLDATGLFGSGLFHHDGPFDACNPHRNKHSKRAPVMAFPEGSASNSMLEMGKVPVFDAASYHGHTRTEAYTDYADTATKTPIVRVSSRSSGEDSSIKAPPPAYTSTAAAAATTTTMSLSPRPKHHQQEPTKLAVRPNANSIRSHSFDTTLKTEPVHGQETLGLGTSTFLDGAPVPRIVLEQQQQLNESGQNGLVRKKSFVQKVFKGSTDGKSSSDVPLRRTASSSIPRSPAFDNVADKASAKHSTVAVSDDDEADSKASNNNILQRVRSLKISSGNRKK